MKIITVEVETIGGARAIEERLSFVSRSDEALKMRSELGRELNREELVTILEEQDRKFQERLSFISRSDEALRLRGELGRELTAKELLAVQHGELRQYAF